MSLETKKKLSREELDAFANVVKNQYFYYKGPVTAEMNGDFIDVWMPGKLNSRQLRGMHHEWKDWPVRYKLAEKLV